MTYPIQGQHHVTATVDAAQADLDFAVDGLGLRLLKKTVNFDNHHVYHFYYGDERGTPGTIWTTFPYHGRGVRVGTRGVGQIGATSFSVPAGSLGYWRARLKDRGTAFEEVEPRFGEESIVATDPSGLGIELVANDRDRRPAWTGADVDPAAAVRGLHSVSMVVRDAARTLPPEPVPDGRRTPSPPTSPSTATCGAGRSTSSSGPMPPGRPTGSAPSITSRWPSTAKRSSGAFARISCSAASR